MKTTMTYNDRFPLKRLEKGDKVFIKYHKKISQSEQDRKLYKAVPEGIHIGIYKGNNLIECDEYPELGGLYSILGNKKGCSAEVSANEKLELSSRESVTDIERQDPSVTIEQLKDKILYKKIVKMDSEKLILEDGTVVSFDCLIHEGPVTNAYGEWRNAELDAIITDIKLEDYKESTNIETFGEATTKAMLVIYHNQNCIAQAELCAESGNVGYYYSVLSVLVNSEVIGELLEC